MIQARRRPGAAETSAWMMMLMMDSAQAELCISNKNTYRFFSPFQAHFTSFFSFFCFFFLSLQENKRMFGKLSILVGIVALIWAHTCMLLANIYLFISRNDASYSTGPLLRLSGLLTTVTPFNIERCKPVKRKNLTFDSLTIHPS